RRLYGVPQSTRVLTLPRMSFLHWETARLREIVPRVGASPVTSGPEQLHPTELGYLDHGRLNSRWVLWRALHWLQQKRSRSCCAACGCVASGSMNLSSRHDPRAGILAQGKPLGRNLIWVQSTS